MGFVEEFIDRGYYYQCTNIDALKTLTNNSRIAAYIGFDCTARSLHIGNLMQIMILRLLQQHGHKPIVIVGGATSKILDPTGKNEMRKALTNEELQQNIIGIKKSLSKFISFGDNENDAILLDNSDWLDNLGYMDFLRDFGPLVSVNRMLSMESAKLRLAAQQNLSFLEFNYMLLQGYDFYHLYKTYGCVLEIGGSDQWGNIVTGVDMIHKALGAEAYGLTTQLLTTSSGAKMGKTLSGAIWINEDMLSPYEYYQYWRNIEDADIIRFAKLYSEWNNQEIMELEILANTDINVAKKHLAHRLTAMCHGLTDADAALETARKVFEEGAISSDLPTISVPHTALEEGIYLFEILHISGLASSKSEAKKLIRGDGVRVNDCKISDDTATVRTKDLINNYIKISVGKKRHILINIG